MTTLERSAVVVCAIAWSCFTAACVDGGPKRRRASPTHDAQCREPARTKAFFYPSVDGKTFAPDDPHADGCVLLVPDFLFCCPETRAAKAR